MKRRNLRGEKIDVLLEMAAEAIDKGGDSMSWYAMGLYHAASMMGGRGDWPIFADWEASIRDARRGVAQ